MIGVSFHLFTIKQESFIITMISHLWDKGGGYNMDRMFRVLAFWTGIFTVMFYVGEMYDATVLFLVQTVFFVTLSYLKLSERMYMYIFGAYLTIFFIGFTYYSSFLLHPSFGH